MGRTKCSDGRKGGEKKSQCDEKGVKYLIYLPWWRETNAFTVIEDASPSHTNTHTYTRTHTHIYAHSGLRKNWIGKARVKLIFLKQNGNTERSGRGICLGKAE